MAEAQGPPPEARPQNGGDFFVVCGESGSWVVSVEMARHVEAMLDAWPRKPWVRFVDLSGSRVRIRADTIDWICQSTVEQRTFDRQHSRALRREHRGEREWDQE